MANDFNIDAFMKRMQKRQKKYTRPLDNENISKAIYRIAYLIQNSAKSNALRQGIKDSGYLINHIRNRIDATGDTVKVTIGVEGVKYARINEYGGPFRDDMRRAMFAKFARLGKGRRSGKENNDVIIGKTWRARPYLRPALTKNRKRILRMLRTAI